MFLKRKIKILLLLIISPLILVFSQTNPKHVKVKGYYRKDGTYVKPHYRTAPNSTNRDNFSTIGNYNPYTGKAGWIQPDNKNVIRTSKSLPTYNGKYNSFGQKVITYSNGEEVFDLCYYCSNISYNSNINYYWYNPYSGIQKTKGSSNGLLLNGEYKFYNKNGDLLIKRNYKKGVEHGDFIMWNENGEIKEKVHFSNGKVDYMKFINDKGYKVEWVGELLMENSVKYVYNQKGLLIESSLMLNNFLARHKLYYEDGFSVKSEFTKGIANNYTGSYKIFYKNGDLKFRGFFKENFRDSIWEWYDKNGKLESILRYRIKTNRYTNGNIKEKGSEYYDHISNSWLKEDEWIQYDLKGLKKEIKYFESGEEIRSKKD